jgi:hypothetical protein
VQLKVRRQSDGAMLIVQRSINVPDVAPPSGHTRVTLQCGGYQATPSGGNTTRMSYVNILNPNGSIPKSIVRATVPERAMIVSRLRRCLEESTN